MYVHGCELMRKSFLLYLTYIVEADVPTYRACVGRWLGLAYFNFSGLRGVGIFMHGYCRLISYQRLEK
jgi:hypothetical protein